MVVLVTLAILVFTRGSAPGRGTGGGGHPAPSPTVPGRPAFFFQIQPKSAAATGKSGQAAADDATVEIAGRLSTFYDTVFMDPNTWKGGVPDQAWSIFDASVLDRAQSDANSFTLGDRVSGLGKLSVSESSLVVKVLLDPAGNPDAAVAEVDFVAAGKLADGSMVDVTNHATFLLHPEGGRWFVFGYPSASTDVETSGGTPTASPTGSASP